MKQPLQNYPQTMKNYVLNMNRGLTTAFIFLFSISLHAKTFTGDVTTGGAITASQTICPGETPLIFESVFAASGGDESLPIEYLWMQNTVNNAVSTSNGWVPATDHNDGITYQCGPINTTTYFVRCARRQGFSTFTQETNIVAINVSSTALAIINGAPTSSSKLYTGAKVDLVATATSGGSYEWDFDGDGTTDCSGISCSYTYNFSGTYTISLTVTNINGCETTSYTTITVSEPSGVGYNDPCNCENSRNFATPSAYYVNDFIRITSGKDQDWKLSDVTSGQLYDENGEPLDLNTEIPEISDGKYFLYIWFVSGVGYDATFTNGTQSVSTGTTDPCSCINPLPVELTYFEASLTNEDKVQLKWATASESNNSHFQIQRSTDGSRFENISIVEGAGSTSSLTNYTFVDVAPVFGANYYRLKQVDFDGAFEYSPIREVFFEKEGISIYPSPAKEFIHIRSLKRLQNDATIEVVNSDAKIIKRYKLLREEGVKSLQLQNFDPGVYFVKIIFANGSYETGSFMKE